MLNQIWLALLLLAALIAGFTGHLPGAVDGAIKAAGAAVTLAFGLVGVMALWLGLMRLAERSGLVLSIARLLRPLLRRLFPDVPPDHPAMGSMVLNIAANMLGLTNAATPLGLRAMRDLQTLNPRPDTATNAMCTFLAINTGSVQLLPVTAIAVLAAAGARQPTAIVGTTLLSTACALTAGLVVAKIAERLPWFQTGPKTAASEAAERPETSGQPAPLAVEPAAVPAPPAPLTVAGGLVLTALGLCFIWFAIRLVTAPPPAAEPAGPLVLRLLNAISLLAIPFLLAFFPLYAALRGLAVYEEFIEGAKEGFQTAVRIIPFLVGMLVAIGFLRGAGGIELLTQALEPVLTALHFPAELLPMALLRPLTGSGTLAAFSDLVKNAGADSLLARTGGTLFGSTETTFYVLAVYFGAAGIRRTRHAVLAGLTADVVGTFAAVIICRFVFA